jgi:hypothetical protein
VAAGGWWLLSARTRGREALLLKRQLHRIFIGNSQPPPCTGLHAVADALKELGGRMATEERAVENGKAVKRGIDSLIDLDGGKKFFGAH